MTKANKYLNYTKEELIEELEAIKKKKYGLVWDKKNSQEYLDAFVNWENVPENFIPKQFPVLQEISKYEIRGADGEPFNFLIEGDNYHSLACLNFTHKNKIDFIYIDPPYNTGNNDFKYNDKFVDKDDPWKHSKWLSFIEKRLSLSRDLLKNTGVCFISIGDDEFAQLKLLCDEIFGEKNFLANIVRKSKETSNKGKYFSPSTDYILCYAKDISNLPEFNDAGAQEAESYLKLFKYEDEKGKYNIVSLYMPSLDPRPNQRYYITCPDGSKVITPKEDTMFRWIPETFKKNLADNRVVFIETKTSPLIDENGNKSKWNVYTKIYLHERQEKGMKPLTFIDMPNSMGSKELIKMNLDFSFSKPKELIKYLISITNKEKDIVVLDFFAGSGTTGQAVLEMNDEDRGSRRFILCTNNENNICTDITLPRIKNVIRGFTDAKKNKIRGLNGNLRYLKTDFVASEPTDKNKRDLVKKSTELICLKEDIFEETTSRGLDYKIFKSKNKYLGVIFDEDAIDEFVKESNKLKGQFVVYCFSYTEIAPGKEFSSMKNPHKIKPIPEVILRVYRDIFKK